MSVFEENLGITKLLKKIRHNMMKQIVHQDQLYQVKTFWEKWARAGELDRVAMVKTLFKDSRLCQDDLDVHTLATLVNSYLVDLEEYMKIKYYRNLDDLVKIVKGRLVKNKKICGGIK
jgi:hypothetical protein